MELPACAERSCPGLNLKLVCVVFVAKRQESAQKAWICTSNECMVSRQQKVQRKDRPLLRTYQDLELTVNHVSAHVELNETGWRM